jgi:phosphoheptose isomerase
VYDGVGNWKETLDRYGIQTVIIDTDVALSTALRNDNEWSKVYEDDQAVIFTRSSKLSSKTEL